MGYVSKKNTIQTIPTIIIMNNKIALIADLHIGVNKNSKEFIDITYEWLEWFLKSLDDNKIKEIFVLGDWHHYRDELNVEILKHSNTILDKLSKRVKVNILTGNHDCYLKDTSEIHSLEVFKDKPNVKIYDEHTEVNIKDKLLSIVPWGFDINDIKKSDYVFGHFEIQNFKWNNHSICKNGLSSKDILSKGMNIYTGHFHKKQYKQYKGGCIRYVGSPFQHDFNDIDNENGYHILNFETGDVEFIENNLSPKFQYLQISKLKSQLNEDNIKNKFIKLFIDTEISDTQIDKILFKINEFYPKNVILESNFKKTLDNSDDLVIESIDILNVAMEYIDSLDTELKKELKEKFNNYYKQVS